MLNHLTSRPYAGPADLERLVDLLLTCRAVEQVDPWPPIPEVRAQMQAYPTLARNTRLWEDAAGRLQAAALIWDGSILVYGIHPQARCDALELLLIDWGIEQVQRMADHTGERPLLCIPVRDDDRAGLALLDQRGFSIEEWRTLRMQCNLDLPIDVPVPPEGFVLRPLAGESEVPAHVALHREAFVAATKTSADRLALMRDPAYLPELDLVAAAPDGRLAAFCLGATSYEENTRTGRGIGWIELLGTRPADRCRGLGRALLLTTLRQMHELGLKVALLSTGSWNLSAQRLVIQCGFELAYQVLWCSWGDEG
jgi:ribosomal protein S18 acetylase RimI-like enzyme